MYNRARWHSMAARQLQPFRQISFEEPKSPSTSSLRIANNERFRIEGAMENSKCQVLINISRKKHLATSDVASRAISHASVDDMGSMEIIVQL